MKNVLVRFLFFLALYFIVQVNVKGLSTNDVYLSRTQLSELDTVGVGWSFYNSGDAPQGAYQCSLSSSVPSASGYVTLDKTLPAGTYNAFFFSHTYNTSPGTPWASLQASMGGASIAVNVDDRDSASGDWSTAFRLVTTSATNRIAIVLTRISGIADMPDPRSMLMKAIYITANTNTVVTSQSEVQDLTPPASLPKDNTPPVKGNQVHNSGFELGTSYGWSPYMAADRPWSIHDHWMTNEHHSGQYSLGLPTTNISSAQRVYISIPIAFTPNKTNTLSAWVKSTSSTGIPVKLRWVNTGVVPSGYTPETELEVSATANTTWQQIQITSQRFDAYPESIGNIQLSASTTTSGMVYWDDIQLEEGTLSTYAPKYPVEFGLHSTVPGKLYYTNDLLEMTLRINNTTASATNLTLFWDVYDTDNRLVTNRVVTVAAESGALKTNGFSIATGRQGIFRGNLYATNHTDEQEYVYAIHPPLGFSGFLTNGIIGSHPNFTTWQLPIMQRMGSTHVRTLSPEADHRWSLVETSEGNFTWHDAEMSLATNSSQIIQGLLGENGPAWAFRYFMPLQSGSGTFTLYETVTNGGGWSGTLSVSLGATNATGFAIQTGTNTGAVPLAGQKVTGVSSGASGIIKSTGTFTATPDFNKWQNFVSNVVAHYTNTVRLWEIWNEPNQDGELPKVGNQSDDLGFYAELARRALLVIPQVDPNAQIVLMGGVLTTGYMTNVISHLDSNWTNRTVALAAHLYDVNSAGMTAFKTAITDVNGKPVWNTETSNLGARSFYTGWGSYQPRDSLFLNEWQDLEVFYRGHRYFPEGLERNLLESLGGAGTRSKWYSYDSRASIRPDAPDGLILTGTLIEYNDGIRVNAAHIAAAERILEGGWGLGKILNSDTNFTGYAFTNNSTGVAGIWTANLNLQNVNVTGQLTRTQYGVYDWMGNTVITNGLLIPISRQPVFVIGNGITALQLSNALVSATLSARTDTVAPNVSIAMGPENKVPLGKPVYIRSFAIDEKDIPDATVGNVITYSTQLSPAESSFSPYMGSGNSKYTSLTSGVYTFSVKAKDSAGNVSSTASRQIVVLNADGSDPTGGPGDTNSAPVLTAIGSKGIDELSTLTFGLSATDADSGQTLTFSLDSGPSGAAINNGAPVTLNNLSSVTIPSLGPATTYPLPIVVSGIAGLISKVTVTLTNLSHEFPDDIDILLVGPTGIKTLLMSDVGGDPNISNVTLTFDDDASTSLPDSSLITSGTYKPTNFEATEVLDAPAPGTPYVTNLTAFVGTAANGTWNLWVRDEALGDVGSMGGWYLTITSGSGTNEFTWTPTEAQGPGTYHAVIRVTDNGTPSKTDFEDVTITVNEANLEPVLNTIPAKSGTVGLVTTFTAVATDADVPAQLLTYTLDSGAPAGAAITSGGAFTWTPIAGQEGANTVRIRVSDNGSPVLSDFQDVVITVAGGNQPPVLDPIGDKTATNTIAMTFTATSTDPDVGQTKAYTLLSGAPGGTSIGVSSGVFNWTPSEGQVGVFPVTVKVTDNGVPNLSDQETINITVSAPAGPALPGTYYVTNTGSLTHVGDGTFTGAGTIADPFKGDWDTILSNRIVGDTVYVGDGSFYTRGVLGFYGHNLKSQQSILGSGTNKTFFILQESIVQADQLDVFRSAEGDRRVRVSGMSIDCTATNNATDAYVNKRGAINLWGNTNWISEIAAIRPYGSWSVFDTMEGFCIRNIYGNGSSVISNCVVSQIKGNYISVFAPQGAYMVDCRVYGNSTNGPLEKIFGINGGFTTNTVVNRCYVEQCTAMLWMDDGIVNSLTVTNCIGTNVAIGYFANFNTPTAVLPIRGVQHVEFARNTVYFNTIWDTVYGMLLIHLSEPTPHTCNSIFQNYITGVTFHDNTLGYGTGVTPPVLTAGHKLTAQVSSDIPYSATGGRGGTPLGINNILIYNNPVQDQTPDSEDFTFDNQLGCAVGGLPNAKNVIYYAGTIPGSGGGGGSGAITNRPPSRYTFFDYIP